jgi:hypothetical protein
MRKYWLWMAMAAIVALGVGGYYGLQGPMLYGRIGTTYVAKQTCSCMFVSGRSLESCQSDLPAGSNIVNISVRGHEVQASAYGLVHARAQFEEGYGCRVEG